MDGRFQSKLLPFPPPPLRSHHTQAAARVNDSERQRATLLFVVGEVRLQVPSVFTLTFAALLCRTL